MRRIGIIGSGKVGCSAATFLLTEADEIVLYDIVPKLPFGEALDLQNAAEALGLNVEVKGTNDISLLHGLDIVAVTAGFGRTPGMSRMDLLNRNLPIIEGIAKEYGGGRDRETVFIIVTNPVDVLTYVFWRRSGVERHRVAGLSGILDSSRLKTMMRVSRGIRISGLCSFVLGEHGENMVILRDRMREEYGLSDTDLDMVLSETVKAAAEIISMKGATVHGPGASIARMVEAVLSDKGEVLPASAVLDGEYGIKDVCLGVPVKAEREGFKVVQEKLSENEVNMLKKAAESIITVLEQIGYRK
ncbi:MAG: malate dehydrogenase [Candidatus Brockarchaeota archaeon]|nr:malate dehydrogenase [Candidatus Brockarchaeota archaeon]MBO3808924.1 malate dehydrogenase [Candidatus Brockarchaeota archaeon]